MCCSISNRISGCERISCLPSREAWIFLLFSDGARISICLPTGVILQQNLYPPAASSRLGVLDQNAMQGSPLLIAEANGLSEANAANS